jgi:hypothetical protein
MEVTARTLAFLLSEWTVWEFEPLSIEEHSLVAKGFLTVLSVFSSSSIHELVFTVLARSVMSFTVEP